MTRKLLIFELLDDCSGHIRNGSALSPPAGARVAIHWGMNGQPNGFSPKDALWFFGPGFLVLILASRRRDALALAAPLRIR